MAISPISFKAEPSKVNNNNQVSKNTEKPEVTVDKEKSMSMEKMVGLGIVAAAAIGGIYYMAKHGGKVKDPKPSTPPTPPSTSPAGAGSSDPVSKFKTILKKRADGTLNKKIVLDKDGHLVSSKQYDKDGTTLLIEKIKVDADTLIKKVYGKKSTVEHFSIVKGENDKAKYIRTKKVTRSNIHSGNHKIEYFDELGRPTRIEQFDKKTGKKLVESSKYEYDGNNTEYGTLRVTRYGKGKSKLDFTEYSDGVMAGSRYDSKGNLRERIVRDKNGKTLSHESIDKKGRRTILENKDGRIDKTKIFTNKKGEEVRHELFIGEDTPPQYRTILIKQNDKQVGEVLFDAQGRKNVCSIKKENFASDLHYNEDGTKRCKIIQDEYGFHTREYDKYGKKTENIRNNKTNEDFLYEKGKLTRWTTKDLDGNLQQETKYYNPKKDGEIGSFTVSHNPDGSSEIYIDYKGYRQTPSGLHYDFSVMKFDKQGNIIPHDYSNRGDKGDINEIRAALTEIGEEGILKDLYRPNGQTSLF